MSKTQRLCHALSLPLVPLRKLAPGLQAEHPTRWPGTSQRFRALSLCLSLSLSLSRFQPASGSVGVVLINQAARLPCGEESCVDVEHHLTECLITQYRDLNARVTVYLIDRTLTTASQCFSRTSTNLLLLLVFRTASFTNKPRIIFLSSLRSLWEDFKPTPLALPEPSQHSAASSLGQPYLRVACQRAATPDKAARLELHRDPNLSKCSRSLAATKVEHMSPPQELQVHRAFKLHCRDGLLTLGLLPWPSKTSVLRLLIIRKSSSSTSSSSSKPAQLLPQVETEVAAAKKPQSGCMITT